MTGAQCCCRTGYTYTAGVVDLVKRGWPARNNNLGRQQKSVCVYLYVYVCSCVPKWNTMVKNSGA